MKFVKPFGSGIAALCALLWLFGCTPPIRRQPAPLPIPSGLRAEPGAERIDLYWYEPLSWHDREDWLFQVAINTNMIEEPVDIPAFSCFTAPHRDTTFHVRIVELIDQGASTNYSAWSAPVSQAARTMEESDLVEEIQRASFRYFRDYRHPVSGLPREGIGGWNRNMCSVAATGMMFFNIAVGIENEWITRGEGLAQLHQSLQFLTEKAERFHGVFPHWLHGATGETIPFSDKDDGADLVETSFLIAGALFVREYLSEDPSDVAAEIRAMAQQLWEDVEWSWFVKDRSDGRRPLLWHWSPKHGFGLDLEVVGFNECQITYLLALASPTFPIQPISYFHGWIHPGYGHARDALGIPLELGRERYGPPAFFMHYSYLGIPPSVFHYGTKNYFEHFEDFCRVQVLWAEQQVPERGVLWGASASMNPAGYGVQEPGKDHGTITPTAYLASWPYAPDAARACLEQMYRDHARSFWGPFGFRDAMSPARNWYSQHYIAINVGPIAPMIENYKTGLGWNTLMRAPEIQRAIELIQSGSER